MRSTSQQLVAITSLLVPVEPSATPYLFLNKYIPFFFAPEYQVLYRHVGSITDHFQALNFFSTHASSYGALQRDENKCEMSVNKL